MEPGDHSSDPCDVGSITRALLGAWRYPDPEHVEHYNYLWFGEQRRVFQTMHTEHRPELPLFSAFKYEVVSSTELLVQHKTWTKGNKVRFSVEGDELKFENNGKTYHCQRVADDELPGWFPLYLEKRLADVNQW